MPEEDHYPPTMDPARPPSISDLRMRHTSAYTAARQVRMPVLDQPGQNVEFGSELLVLLFHLLRSTAPDGTYLDSSRVQVETIRETGMVVRLDWASIHRSRFLLVPMGECRQLCTVCEADAIGGSHQLEVCPKHLDAPLGAAATAWNGQSPYDVNARVEMRVAAWEKRTKAERGAATAAVRRLSEWKGRLSP